MKKFFSNPYVITGLVILAVIGIFVYIKNRNKSNGSNQSRTSPRCCIERDSNCRCVNWVFKASDQCEPVPCPEIKTNVIITDHAGNTGGMGGNNGTGVAYGGPRPNQTGKL